MRKFLFLLFAVFFFAGCLSNVQGDLPAKEILAKTVLKSASINSYEAVTTVLFDVAMNSSRVGSGSFMNFNANQESQVDSENKKYHAKSKMQSTVFSTPVEGEFETYVVNDTAYEKYSSPLSVFPSEWRERKVDGSRFSWKEPEEYQELLVLLEDAKIESLNDEVVDGVDYHVIKVTPQKKKLVGVSEAESVSGINEDQPSEFIKKMTVTLWVNKQTFYTEKVKTRTSILVKEEEGQINGELFLDVKIKNINEPVEIILPEEITG